MDSTRHQEILDRCWEALPEGCPMRQWDREQFDDVWGCWHPIVTAIADPGLKRNFSILISVLMNNEEVKQSPKSAPDYWGFVCWAPETCEIYKHYQWLIEKGSEEDLEQWNKEVRECKRKLKKTGDKRLLMLILVMEEWPYKHMISAIGKFWKSIYPSLSNEEARNFNLFSASKTKDDKLVNYHKDRSLVKVALSDIKEAKASIYLKNFCSQVEGECKELAPEVFANLTKNDFEHLWEAVWSPEPTGAPCEKEALAVCVEKYPNQFSHIDEKEFKQLWLQAEIHRLGYFFTSPLEDQIQASIEMTPQQLSKLSKALDGLKKKNL
jgi:hypothetical protein